MPFAFHPSPFVRSLLSAGRCLLSVVCNPFKTPWMIATTILTFTLLAVVQLVVKPPLLLGERLLSGGGWIQATAAALFAGWLYRKMTPRATRGIWRRRIWLLFSIVFFGQLLLGIMVDSMFLMTGALHFPIPGLIPIGAIYRWQLSFMPILFIITILLSGGAWCSQLCYFGALDSLAAGSGKRTPIGRHVRTRLRISVLIVFIIAALCLRLLAIPSLPATLLAAGAGIIGVCVILTFSRRKKTMLHCSAYCPAGTLVSYLKYLSPWRFRINPAKCTQCMACSRLCRYGALQKEDIRRHTPGNTCTYCGDCLAACHHEALGYHVAGCSPVFSEKLWLCVTITLFTCFLSIARI